MNGHLNGSISASRPSKTRKTKPRRTYVGWAIDKGAKIFVWYTLATVLFRCPSSSPDLTATSPALCKSYLQARDFVLPYARPYYDDHLAPHIQKVQPYFDRVHEQVYKPGVAAYEKHGAPRVVQAQKFGNEQWKKTIKPQLDVLQEQASKQYDASLATHVKKAQDVVQPYYDSARSSANGIWERDLHPVYQRTAPYAQKLYGQGHRFAVNIALPHAQHASNVTWSFWRRHIWPRLRILYGENVEPQLMRITERLGRYKDGKKLEADIKSLEASSKLQEASASAESIGASLSSTILQATADPSAASSIAASSTPKVDPVSQFREELKSWEHINARAVDEGSEDLTERIKEIITHQINSQANGVGSALVVQLEEAADAAINNVKSRIQNIARDVSQDAGEENIQQAHDDIVKAIRYAGQTVKHRAQAVRDWRHGYQTETENLINKALQSTLETIDGIRELRLSEIGRKYASSSLPHKEWAKYNELKKATRSWRDKVEKAAGAHPGVHEAKTAGEDVEQRAMGIAEEVAQELGRLKDVARWKVAARDDSEDFETRYIPPVAERARQQVVQKVSEASEAAFGSETRGTLEQASSAVSEQASRFASSASEAVQGASIVEAASAVSKKASEAASTVSESLVGSSTGSVESAASALSSKASSAASGASKAVIGSSKGSVESVSSKLAESAQAIASTASENVLGKESSFADTVTEAASRASAAVLGDSAQYTETLQDAAAQISLAAGNLPEALSSQLAEAAKAMNSKMSSIAAAGKASGSSGIVDTVVAAASSASSAVGSAVGDATSSASSVASDASSTASSAATAASKSLSSAGQKASKKVLGGAMAQVLVEAREPILDDVVDGAESFTERLQSIFSAAGDQASALTQAVEEALKRATSTQGTVESVTSLASAQYESAIAAASSALFRSKGPAERGTSLAKEQYLAAVTAASYAIYGTPSPASLAAQASALYSSAVSEASKNFEMVKSEVSKQISGKTTPVPVYQQILQNAESVFSSIVATASSNLHSPFSAPTPNADDSISAIASSRLAEGVSFAVAQFQSAKIAVGAEPTPVHQQYLSSAQRAYYEALGLAHDQYSQFVSAASSVVGATPTTGLQGALAAAQNTYSAAVAAASSNFNILLSSASSVVGATTKSPAESVLASLSSQYNVALSVASSQLVAASSQASEAFFGTQTGAFEAAAAAASTAVYGKETPLAESIASQASENWEALLSKASQQVYGAPAPLTAVIAQQAGAYAAQASKAAAAQYDAVQSLLSEIISGKEPDFTESVMRRLQSAYETGAPAVASSASSYASVAYASAASAVSAAFVPPTAVPGILEQMNEQLNAAVEAASAQFYGTSKGTIQQATEAAASAYSDAASAVSEAVYGRETGVAEAAQSNIIDIGASASSAISVALYGPGTVAAASSAAASVFSSISSQAAAQASAASAAVSSVVFGEEQTYAESLQSQLAVALASASSRIAAFGAQASDAAQDTVSAAQQVVQDAVSSVSSLASQASSRVKDEL